MTKGVGKGLVIDSSALYYGKDLPSEFELIISPGIASELRRHGMGDRLDLLLATKVKILSPSKESLIQVLAESKASGDLTRLSSADKEILALALDLGYELVTDDYSIQNVAAALGVSCRPLDQNGISRTIVWESVCTGCRKRFAAHVEECDICGSATKTTGRKHGGR
ncbi:MAG: nucleic acid-binding protein [Methanobacteriota archaeon]|nr:MAG: nucleic acid-binding protein [Euryarchaeota archaeon]